MTRRTKLAAALVAGGVLVGSLAACGSGSGSGNGSAGSGSGGSGGSKTLTVATWKSYGADDPWAVKTFEHQTGAKVKFVYFSSESGMLQLLQQGGIGKIDLILPNLEYVQPAASQGLIQPIDTSKISTWNSLEPSFRNQKSIVYNGKTYAVPWVQGNTSLAYNPKDFKTPVTSWSTLWDPKYAGKVGFFDDPITAIQTAAVYLHENPQHPDLAKVKQALETLKSHAKVLWSSADDWDKGYTSGAITIGNLWSGLAGSLQASGTPVKYVLPQEGAIAWGDTWAIANNAPEQSLAYKWINFYTSKQYFTHWITHPGPNQELALPVNVDAVKALPASAKTKLEAEAILNFKGKIVFQSGIPLQTLNQWTQLWEQVKAS